MRGLPWFPVALLLCVMPHTCYSTTSTPTVDECKVTTVGSIYCVFERWDPNFNFKELAQRGQIENLRVSLNYTDNLTLTPAHLRGMRRLKNLTIVGPCHLDEKGTLRPCEDVGLSDIEKLTFRETPKLESLTLSRHPMTRLQNLMGLSKLTRLKLWSMPNLKTIELSAMHPIRGSIRHMEWNHLLLTKLHPFLFDKMNSLQSFTYTCGNVSRKTLVESSTFTNLKRLQSLSLDRIILQANALAHLPSLQEITLRSADVEITENPTDLTFGWLKNAYNVSEVKHQRNKKTTTMTTTTTAPVVEKSDKPVCNLENSDLRSIHVALSEPRVLQFCKGLFNCRDCGAQRVHLFNVNFLKPQPLASFLPVGDSKLNISELEVINCGINAIGRELLRLPFLKKLLINEAKTLFRPTYTISRLVVNPLQFHPSPNRLEEVQLSVNECDCIVLNMSRWFSLHAASGAKLHFACENFRCEHEPCTATIRHMNAVIWQKLPFMTTILESMCSNSVKTNFSKQNMCNLGCDHLKLGRIIRRVKTNSFLMKAFQALKNYFTYTQ